MGLKLKRFEVNLIQQGRTAFAYKLQAGKRSRKKNNHNYTRGLCEHDFIPFFERDDCFFPIR